MNVLDFLGDPMVRNPPANEGDIGLILGPGRFHTAEQLSQSATVTEPMLCNKRRHRNKKPMYCNGKQSPLAHN